MKRSTFNSVDIILRMLAAHRLLIYISGLALISVPTISRVVFRNEFPGAVRTAIVVVGFAGMVLTYIGEQRITNVDSITPVGERTQERLRSGPTDSVYSRQARMTFAIGIVCVVIGVYAVFEVSPLIGVLFIVGGLLVSQITYYSKRNNNRTKE
jgi:hypothetical protein